MQTVSTRYLNTDLELAADEPFPRLIEELGCSCHLILPPTDRTPLNCLTAEAAHEQSSDERSPSMDITDLVTAINRLSHFARSDFDRCTKRDFNVGFDCGDDWATQTMIDPASVAAIASVGGSLTVTLYPSRHPDGRLRDPDG